LLYKKKLFLHTTHCKYVSCEIRKEFIISSFARYFFFGFETIESRLEVVEEVDCLRDTNDDSQDESPEIDCFVELLVL
jgi:hypothetical protein